MIVLAIDPGNEESAYLVFDTQSDIITEFGKVSNEDLINLIDDYENSISYFIIEGIVSYGMPVGKTVLHTKFFVGRLYQLALKYVEADSIFIVSRKEVMLHHCGSVKGKDANLRQALIDKYGEPGTKKKPGFTYGISKDMWSALGIATYFVENKLTNTPILDIIKDERR